MKRNPAAWHIVPAPCHAVPNVARFAHRAAFNGWMCAAARARASVLPCPIAPPAPVTRKRAAPFRVSAAVIIPSSGLIQ